MKTTESYFAFVLLYVSLTVFTEGCNDFLVKKGGIISMQVDTNVHVPLSTTVRFTLAQCIQDCFYVSMCSIINYEPSSGTCHFLNISGAVTEVTIPTSTWNMVYRSDVQWTPPTKNFCVTNDCNSGESCFLFKNATKKCVVF